MKKHLKIFLCIVLCIIHLYILGLLIFNKITHNEYKTFLTFFIVSFGLIVIAPEHGRKGE